MVEYAAALEELFESTNKPVEAKKQRQLIDAVDTLSQARGEKANRVLALIYVDENRKLEEAVRLTEAELENRGDVYTYDALSWVYFRTGKLDQAREMSAKALKCQTAEPIFYFHAGVISAGQDPARFEQLLRHALELNPNFDRKHAAEARKRLAQPVAPAAR
jgi:tetratricopeptide (TPR) repeat protein